MKKKIIILAICAALAAIAVIGSTMAYYTDSVASAGNVIKAGNVDVKLIVSDQDITPNGTQVTDNTYDESTQVKKANITILPGFKLDEYAYIENTGTNDAYVRLRVLIPEHIFPFIDITASTNYTLDSPEVYSPELEAIIEAKKNDIQKNEAVNYDSILKKENEYYIIDFIYLNVLKPGEITACKTWTGLAIAGSMTTENIESLKDTEEYSDTTKDYQFNVKYEAHAIQTSLVFGSEDNNNAAIDAFHAFDGETTAASTTSEP
ncbi:MAG: hypothetical protein IJA85_08075 [Clostridia bacterium]|nr:hypothetical protein [Clostridia bacterium]